MIRYFILQVNENQSAVTLKCDEEEFQWKVGESLVRILESKKIVKQIFPLHGIISLTSLKFCSSMSYILWK